jgi:hypothetical protein
MTQGNEAPKAWPRSCSAVDHVGACSFRRRAVNKDDELLAGLVGHLVNGACLDMRNRTNRDLMTHRRVAEVHRERAIQRHECLILRPLNVPWTNRAGRVANKVRSRMTECRAIGQRRTMAARVIGVLVPLEPI